MFRSEYAGLDTCPECGALGYKVGKSGNQHSKKHAEKILRYFPLIPRLQHLFISSKTAKLTEWHEQNKSRDGHIYHPVDSNEWIKFDNRHVSFT